MTYQDNDTLNKGQQNKNQSQADKDTKKMHMDAMTAKLLTSVAAGMAAGAGVTFAAERLTQNEDSQTEEIQEENLHEEENAVEEQPAEPTIEERIETLEEKERMREQQEAERQRHEAERQRQEQLRQKNEENRQKQEHDENEEENHEDENVLKDHDVKIDSIEERTLEDGTRVRVYTGTIDGHQAAFMDDGNGKVVAAIIDANDNGEVDDNEVLDLSTTNVPSQYLVSCKVEVIDNEVNVIAVHHDVEFAGQTVDVAFVEINHEEVAFIDVDKDNEVDIAITDRNHNGCIDEGETQVVSSAHITMPTEDDITSNMVASLDDGTEDYSNNADVEVYDV